MFSFIFLIVVLIIILSLGNFFTKSLEPCLRI
jgi:hypothetical protein